MPGLGPMKIISLKHPKKNGKGLLFPIFCRTSEFALKVWKIFKKKQNTIMGFEPQPHLEYWLTLAPQTIRPKRHWMKNGYHLQYCILIQKNA